ncbi:exodeoxyribonuclease III [Candidatus Zixiibacteriota bacterium]
MSADRIRAATFNVNSIRVRMEILLGWLQENEPDILCLQETKVQDPDFPVDPIKKAGYHVVFKGQKAHAGVAIISREKPENVAWGLDDGGPPDEARLIRATIAGIAVVNTYVPQGRSPDSEQFEYKLRWLARMKDFFERNYSLDDPLLWMGDLNVAREPIDVHDPVRLKDHVDFHPLAREALEKVRGWGFVDVFRKHHPNEPNQYSYYDYRALQPIERGTGWRVDHIFATLPLTQRSIDSWIDLEPRKRSRPSDHTVLAADFSAI